MAPELNGALCLGVDGTRMDGLYSQMIAQGKPSGSARGVEWENNAKRLEFRDQNMVLADDLSGLTAIHTGMEFVGRDFLL